MGEDFSKEFGGFRCLTGREDEIQVLFRKLRHRAERKMPDYTKLASDHDAQKAKIEKLTGELTILKDMLLEPQSDSKMLQELVRLRQENISLKRSDIQILDPSPQ